VITEQTVLDCQLVNISATGVLVTLPVYYPSERRVHLSFNIEQVRLTLEGVIARRCRINSAHAWGISFRHLSTDTRQLLSHYVRCRLAAVVHGLRPDNQIEQQPPPAPPPVVKPEQRKQPTAPPPAGQTSALPVDTPRRRWIAANLKRIHKRRSPKE
jgi:hypothetical protein